MEFPVIMPLRAEDVKPLKEVAKADNHTLLFPTHVIRRSGEVVGYCSMGGMPILNTWVHSERVRARESAMLLNVAENVMRATGSKAVVTPCSADSPFFPLMEKLGYSRMGQTTLNLKRFE